MKWEGYLKVPQRIDAFAIIQEIVPSSKFTTFESILTTVIHSHHDRHWLVSHHSAACDGDGELLDHLAESTEIQN